MQSLGHYHPPYQEYWKGRPDEERKERFHHVVRTCDLSVEKLVFAEEKTKIALIGFASDKGVRKNYGKGGAYQGPREFRRALSGMPILSHSFSKLALYDFGDIECGEDLEDAQKDLGEAVSKVVDLGFIPFVIGGGHEVAYGQWLGLSGKEDMGILNFDAHFDLRPVREGGTSGTPFWQIHQECTDRGWPFTYGCLGIQEISNTRALFEMADNLGVTYLTAEDLGKGKNYIEAFLKKRSRIYLSLDLDVFSAAFAPGVSAVNPFGVTPREVEELLLMVAKSGKVCAFHIAELNPKYDKDGRTAKLAAALFAKFVDTLLS